MEQSEEARHFAEIAADFERMQHFDSLPAKIKVERLSKAFAAYLDASPAGPVLELGAGTGFLTRRLAPLLEDRRYIASDISREMLDVAKAMAGPEDRVEYRLLDCTRLELDDDSVSGVVGHGILHHVPLGPAIGEMRRVLVPGGRIAFYEPNVANPLVFAQKKLKIPFLLPEADSRDETALFAPSLRRRLAEYGFREIRVTPGEFLMNQTPPELVPMVMRMSAFADGNRILRQIGGSLTITAVTGP